MLTRSLPWLPRLIPLLTRNIVNKAATRPVPRGKGAIQTPHDFLRAIGRSSETKLSIDRWEEFWGLSGPKLRSIGVAVRDRKYIMWCMEKYRLGFPVGEFAREAPPKKTVRGWGPAVQNGKRIRSRRLKANTK